MSKFRTVTLIFSLVVLLTANLHAQEKSAEISGVGYWTTVMDWEGDPFTLEWDSDFQYGAAGAVNFNGFHLSGRWMFGDFDLSGAGLNENWSLNNLEIIGGYQLMDSPIYILAGYKHWELNLDESTGTFATSLIEDFSVSFDGLGGGAGIYWQMPESGMFFNGQALYFFEIDSSLDILEDSGFSRALTFNGELGFTFYNGFFVAAGARFEQVAQDLPEDERVAPFTDYGFEQLSATFRVGFRFGM